MKGMFKEYNLNDFYGRYFNASRIPIILRKVCKIIGKSAGKTVWCTLRAALVSPSVNVIVSAELLSVLETALFCVSEELGFEAAHYTLQWILKWNKVRNMFNL